MDERALRFEPFVGIAPRRFAPWFARTRRKDGAGYALQWDRTTAQPVESVHFRGYLEKESSICAKFAHAMDEHRPSHRSN